MSAPRVDDRGPHRVVGRRQVLLGAAGLGLAAAGTVAARPSTPGPGRYAQVHALDPDAVFAVTTRSPHVALTFDDGPDPEFTPHVLDILAEHDVRATFFMIGRAAAEHPELVRQVLAAGHDVANHTLDHPWLDTLDEAAIEEELTGWAATMSGLSVDDHRLFRPPGGRTSAAAVRAARRLGLRSYYWGTCLEANLSHHGLAEAAARTAGRLLPGSIVLAHDGGHLDGPHPQSIDRGRTLAALPLLIDLARDRGLGFLPLSEMVRLAARDSG